MISLDKSIELDEFEKLEKRKKIDILEDPVILHGHVKFENGGMKCHVYFECFMSILGSSLCSMPSVIKGNHYFAWSECNPEFDIVYQSYDEFNMLIYTADNETYGNNYFVHNGKYGLKMRPLSQTVETPEEIPNLHKIVIMPKIEFYKIIYEKALHVKRIFAEADQGPVFIPIKDNLEYVGRELKKLGAI